MFIYTVYIPAILTLICVNYLLRFSSTEIAITSVGWLVERGFDFRQKQELFS